MGFSVASQLLGDAYLAKNATPLNEHDHPNDDDVVAMDGASDNDDETNSQAALKMEEDPSVVVDSNSQDEVLRKELCRGLRSKHTQILCEQ